MDAETPRADHPRCLWCEYDLFGLPAEDDIVRCPECGNRSDLRLASIPPKERARRVRGMESLPAISAVSALFGAYFAILAFLERPWRPTLTDVLHAFIACAVLGAAVWLVSTFCYVHRYRFVLRAREMLVLFHLCAALFFVSIPLGYGGLTQLLSPSTGYSLSALAAALGGAGALALGVWLYRRARRILRHMHDQLAGRKGN